MNLIITKRMTALAENFTNDLRLQAADPKAVQAAVIGKVNALNELEFWSNVARISSLGCILLGAITNAVLASTVGLVTFLLVRYTESVFFGPVEEKLTQIARSVNLELKRSIGTDLLFRSPILIRS